MSVLYEACVEPCDHCAPDAWHQCVKPYGHSGFHSCDRSSEGSDE
jgi:hypothetical protein